MKTQITFRDFKGFDHLRDYVQTTIDQTVGKFDLSRSADVNVIIGTDHARHFDGRSPHFLCEATIRFKSQKIFVKKLDVDFQAAVRKCMKTVSDILVKKTRTRRHKIRRGMANMAQMSYGINYATSTNEI
jgi:ribosome-associated translation inhibitor RaiA